MIKSVSWEFANATRKENCETYCISDALVLIAKPFRFRDFCLGLVEFISRLDLSLEFCFFSIICLDFAL